MTPSERNLGALQIPLHAQWYYGFLSGCKSVPFTVNDYIRSELECLVDYSSTSISPG